MTYPIVECSGYDDRNLPSLTSMNQIAWFISADKKSGKIGFTHGQKADDELKDETYKGNPFG